MGFIKEKLKNFLKRYPSLYAFAKILYAKLNAVRRFIKYGNCNQYSCKITAKRRNEESAFVFEKNIKFSILVPLYNTPKKFLDEMVKSVQYQTYANWELCLADGSDSEHAFVEKYCLQAAENDCRIKYKKLAENKGISENTNECIKMATGDFIALFDHDDVLHPSALFECMKAICFKNADYVYTDEATFLGDSISTIISYHFKPDYAYDNLIANNYICHFSVFSARLIEKAGMFRSKYDGSQDHDIILRLTDAAENVVHIPKLLYFWRSHANSVAMDINSKTYAIEAGRAAVRDFLASKGIDAVVESSPAFPTIYRVTYKIEGEPKVSIIIPNKDNSSVLKTCIDSILEKTTYKNYEIIIIDNQSKQSEIFDYYDRLKQNGNIKVYSYDKPFNYSAINNYAVANADGDYLLLLNNDTEVIAENWIQELLMFAQRKDVGAVGAKLFYPDKRVQHGGIILGLGEHHTAGHSHCGADENNLGYMGKLFYAQDVSAVTAACLMVKRSEYLAVGGFDEKLAVSYNDVDFCLKLRKKGLLNIFNPFCTLYHYESLSRGSDAKAKNEKRFGREMLYFKNKWKNELENGDPYYNPNFSLKSSYYFDFGRR